MKADWSKLKSNGNKNVIGYDNVMVPQWNTALDSAKTGSIRLEKLKFLVSQTVKKFLNVEMLNFAPWEYMNMKEK